MILEPQTSFPSAQSGKAVHRIDIDGLRALAVAVVVLFHADLLPGGFIGVDIFFVISGYLMASIISQALDDGRFSLMDFYARRARRIIPALVVVMAIIAVAGSLFMLPHDIKDLGRSIVAASTFTSNLWFRDIAADYFAAENVLYQPMLHSWSLAVEAQFYVMFPLVLILIHALAKRRTLLLIASLALISLCYSAYAVHSDPQAAFYLLASRMWELLAGALIYFLPPLARRQGVVAALGAVCIAIALCAYHPAIGFPGLAALLPVIGAGLILYARPGMQGPSAIRTLLTSFPVATTGKISYSLYLWHWPLFVFARYNLGPELPLALDVCLIVLAVLLSWASWRWVEQPFLQTPQGVSVYKKMMAPLAMIAVLICIGGIVKNVVPKYTHLLLPEKVVALAEAERDFVRGDCDVPNDKDFPCRFGAKGQAPTVLVWGNSFARMWMPGLDVIAGEYEAAGIAAIRSACRPVGNEESDAECAAFNQQTLNFILANPAIETVVLSANWTTTPSFNNELEQIIRQLSDKKKRIYFVMKPPHPDYPVPRALALAELRSDKPPQPIARAVHEAERKQYQSILEPYIKNGMLRVIDPTDNLCAKDICPVQNAQGDVLYYDGAHVTKTAAILHRGIFSPVFSN